MAAVALVAALPWTASLGAPAAAGPDASDGARAGHAAFPGGRARAARAVPDLELLWYDPETLVPFGVEAVAREVEAIFATVGRRIVLRAGTGLEPPGRRPLRVILVRRPAAAWDLGEDVMGVAPGSGRPRRNIYVIAPTVRAVIGQDPAAVLEEGSREIAELTLALARVLAHEIVHAVAPRHPHAAEGLMSPQQKRDSLLAGSFVLDELCVKAFLRGLRRL